MTETGFSAISIGDSFTTSGGLEVRFKPLSQNGPIDQRELAGSVVLTEEPINLGIRPKKLATATPMIRSTPTIELSKTPTVTASATYTEIPLPTISAAMQATIEVFAHSTALPANTSTEPAIIATSAEPSLKDEEFKNGTDIKNQTTNGVSQPERNVQQDAFLDNPYIQGGVAAAAVWIVLHFYGKPITHKSRQIWEGIRSHVWESKNELLNNRNGEQSNTLQDNRNLHYDALLTNIKDEDITIV